MRSGDVVWLGTFVKEPHELLSRIEVGADGEFWEGRRPGGPVEVLLVDWETVERTREFRDDESKAEADWVEFQATSQRAY